MSNVTTQQIQALMNEAGSTGDSEMYATCERALEGDEAAIKECSDVIAYAAERSAE